MSLDRRLSALEFTVLGIILKKGPCTAYAVLAEFTHSASSAYRSGAGSVYPLLKRLEGAGLVTAEKGKREKRYTLSDAGLAALRDWFELTSEDISCCLDVLRSRAYFLKILTPAERKAFLEAALAGLQVLLAQCRLQVEGYAKAGDRFSEMAMEGAVLETSARIRWIRSTLVRL